MTNSKGQQFIEVLHQENTYINQLMNTLIEEKESLSKRDFTHMQELAVKKDNLSNLLEESSKKRLAILNAQADTAKDALNSLINSLNQEEATLVKQLNQELTNKITACRELNAINGQVITSNLNTRREIVDVLTGKDTKTAINTYSSSGNLRTHSESINHQEA